MELGHDGQQRRIPRDRGCPEGASARIGDCGPIDPCGPDQGGDGKRGDPAFAVVNHAQEHVHRHAATQIIVLFHACPFGSVASPLKLDQSDVLRNPESEILNPCSHDVVESENHVRPVGFEPAPEDSGIHARGMNIKEGWNPILGRKQKLARGVTGAESVFHEIVDFLIQNQTRTTVAEINGFFERPKREDMVVHTSKGHRRAAGSHTGYHAGKGFNGWNKALRDAVLFHHTNEKDTPYPAGQQDILPPVS